MRWVLALLFASLASALPAGAQEARSASAMTDFRVGDPESMDARAKLLERAEAELARGQTEMAIETFERAAMMLHSPDTEMGLVRAYMQAGQYRRALAFCAHVAGAHLESGASGALYAWLLRAGGQGDFAERVLRSTLDRLPQDAVALETRKAFASPAPVTTGPLLRMPQRMAPRPVMEGDQPAVPDSARVVASGVLIGNGTMALVPGGRTGPGSAKAIWVRDGMGRTTRAREEPAIPPFTSAKVTLLRLDPPLRADEGMPPMAPREPFAGSAGFAFEFAAQDEATAAWPWMSQGFFGVLPRGEGPRKLGIGVAASTYGGPVLDAAGRLAGMVLPGQGGEPVMLPSSGWEASLSALGLSAGSNPVAPALQGSAARLGGAMPSDEAYERGLRIALQVLVER